MPTQISRKDEMQLSDWLMYLETLHPKAIDLGLERVSLVAQKLKLLPWTCPTITVTGTNGKGSCVAILESVLSASGYRVGAYTSPHLFNYNERIRIQGQPVSDNDICRVFERIETARADISLTYFEFGTLAALLLFQEAKLDHVILEVGLGGRLDAVNIIDADIAIITTIALDHQDWLGPDRESIGREKTAIARPNKPIICGDFDIPASVRNYANQLAAPLYCQGIDFGYTDSHSDRIADREQTWSWWGSSRHLFNLSLPVLELQNVSTALKAIEFLEVGGMEFKISQKIIEQALRKIQLAGRFQVIEGSVTHIFDVAHNPAAALCLAERLFKTPCKGRTLAVVAVSLGKDHNGIFEALGERVQDWYVGDFKKPPAISSEVLAQSLSQLGMQSIHCHTNVVEAYRAAALAAQSGDRIVVFGSHYTVAIVFTYYRSNE
jgi:dihydrofolate synthase/folylpolyglutamate synthase